MSILTAPPPPVNTDSREVPYAGHRVTGRELSRIMAARRRAYGARTGSCYDESVDAAMDAAGRDELDRILAERIDAMADEAATLDRLESGYCL